MKLSEKIFKKLSDDIRDRKGIGDEWESIDSDIMRDEIKPTWIEIIEKVLNEHN